MDMKVLLAGHNEVTDIVIPNVQYDGHPYVFKETDQTVPEFIRIRDGNQILVFERPDNWLNWGMMKEGPIQYRYLRTEFEVVKDLM
jgi:hypothetical protein